MLKKIDPVLIRNFLNSVSDSQSFGEVSIITHHALAYARLKINRINYRSYRIKWLNQLIKQPDDEKEIPLKRILKIIWT